MSSNRFGTPSNPQQCPAYGGPEGDERRCINDVGHGGEGHAFYGQLYREPLSPAILAEIRRDAGTDADRGRVG